jgi:hypothetical protein
VALEAEAASVGGTAVAAKAEAAKARAEMRARRERFMESPVG